MQLTTILLFPLQWHLERPLAEIRTPSCAKHYVGIRAKDRLHSEEPALYKGTVQLWLCSACQQHCSVKPGFLICTLEQQLKDSM